MGLEFGAESCKIRGEKSEFWVKSENLGKKWEILGGKWEFFGEKKEILRENW